MRQDVFISHSSEDASVAASVCEALERRGLQCWIAPRDIGPGENFQEAIVRAIRGVRAMVLVFTGNANDSSEIKKEVALASQNRLVVIPLRVEDVLPNDAFAYELSTRQWIDAFEDWDRAMVRVAEQLALITAAQPSAATGAGPGGGSRRAAATGARGRVARWGAAVAALLAVVVGGGLAYRSLVVLPAAAPASAPTAAPDVSGEWESGVLTNPYNEHQSFVLRFEFEQSGTVLFGTVSHGGTDFRGASASIQDGRVEGGAIVFHTNDEYYSGGAFKPYKTHYRGEVEGETIALVKQNDTPGGGRPLRFTVRRGQPRPREDPG